ncbi:uncharacterized protein TRIREDRAFT_104354 [Trichoderma reesei QM6a]|jgi:hypothetical protein|uniref:Predicted protein n=2 Tax=Hypocrea jecorina TaxID=51453 RepID=G0RC59_HYPJQ|nr:uncharacterized protein TRIREDRAFT_104354 [Trichoderma reesei QM6a]EGR51450.1 predicted protein [Trichoderma reesei QM6a]ETS04574.1 hypothetical protein M419DRAFT_127689 [Trichoderma reesei RUT C-30]
MRVSLCLSVCLLILHAIAGGIRGAFERLYIWWAYQAEIEYAHKVFDSFDVSKLQICHGQRGSGPGATLTFAEFLELSNRQGNTKGAVTSKTFKPDSIGSTAEIMLKLTGQYQMQERWPRPTNIISSSQGRYTDMLDEVSNVLSKCKQDLGDSRSINLALDAFTRVIRWRKADYEKHRFPALKSNKDFEAIKEWRFWTVGGDKRNKGLWRNYIDFEGTIASAHNSGYKDIENLESHVLNWERTTYFKGTDGARASQHKHTIVAIQDALTRYRSATGC